MRITERQLRQIIREELNEMTKPEGDPSDPSYRSAMRRYYKSQEQGDEPKRQSAGHGRFPGMDDEDPEPIPRMWFDQGRGGDDDLDESDEMLNRPRGMRTLPGGAAHENPSGGRSEAYGTIRPEAGLDDDDAVDDIRAKFQRLHGVEGLNIYRDDDGTLYGSYVKPHMRHKVYSRYSTD